MLRIVSALACAALLAACDAGPSGASCQPGCAGRACGDDGCGGSCGACGAGLHCDGDGACLPDAVGCTPACGARRCGDDGCGGSCGACPSGTACGEDGACASSSCPAGEACRADVYVAYAYECTRASDAEAWTCQPLASLGWYDGYAACWIACAGGESACHENDSDVGAACRACTAGCARAVDATCDLEAPGSCPAPCACRPTG